MDGWCRITTKKNIFTGFCGSKTSSAVHVQRVQKAFTQETKGLAHGETSPLRGCEIYEKWVEKLESST